MNLKQVYWVKQNSSLGTWNAEFAIDNNGEPLVGRVTIAMFIDWSNKQRAGVILQRSCWLTEADENLLVGLTSKFVDDGTRLGRRNILAACNAQLQQTAEVS